MANSVWESCTQGRQKLTPEASRRVQIQEIVVHIIHYANESESDLISSASPFNNGPEKGHYEEF